MASLFWKGMCLSAGVDSVDPTLSVGAGDVGRGGPASCWREERAIQTEFFSRVQHSQDQNGLLFILACAWRIELCPKNNNKACFGSWSHSSVGKGPACNVGNQGSIPGLGRPPGEGNDTPLLYSCLENPMDRGAWQATCPWGHKSRTRLSN